MKLDTRFHGELEIEDKDIITFQNGIPGFRDMHKYVLIHDEEIIYSYLQSLDDSQLCFIVIPPALIVGNYDIDIDLETIEELQIQEQEDILVFSILTIPEDINQATANLAAPILINIRNNKAAQIVINDERYPIKHKLLKEGE